MMMMSSAACPTHAFASRGARSTGVTGRHLRNLAGNLLKETPTRPGRDAENSDGGFYRCGLELFGKFNSRPTRCVAVNTRTQQAKLDSRSPDTRHFH